jgi:hypothetical protein
MFGLELLNTGETLVAGVDIENGQFFKSVFKRN